MNTPGKITSYYCAGLSHDASTSFRTVQYFPFRNQYIVIRLAIFNRLILSFVCTVVVNVVAFAQLVSNLKGWDLVLNGLENVQYLIPQNKLLVIGKAFKQYSKIENLLCLFSICVQIWLTFFQCRFLKLLLKDLQVFNGKCVYIVENIFRLEILNIVITND